MLERSEWWCVQEADEEAMDTDVIDDMEHGEAVNYLLEIAIKKRRRAIRNWKKHDLRKDCLQKCFINKLCDEIDRILKEREEEDKKATEKSKPAHQEEEEEKNEEKEN